MADDKQHQQQQKHQQQHQQQLMRRDWCTSTRLMTVNDQCSPYVKLNVGGALYCTTISTLTKHDSMLQAMFSGRMEVLTDNEGWILIDRCGKHFGTILNFLRDGNVALPECRFETLEILAEAKYYLIQELVQQCEDWLSFMKKDDVEPVGVCRVPIICTKKDCDRIVTATNKPVIKLLLNRHNNKYSYTSMSDDNLLKNLELFDRLVVRFTDRVLFVKDIGSENAEVLYATDRKQTKVEFPEVRIYEEAMNVLLFEERHLCAKCGCDMQTCSPNNQYNTYTYNISNANFAHLHSTQQANNNSTSLSRQSNSPSPFCNESSANTSNSGAGGGGGGAGAGGAGASSSSSADERR